MLPLPASCRKDLKAYIIFLDLPLNKTHNLIKLIDQIKELDIDILKLQEDVELLTDYIVSARYPDDSEPITDDESKLAFSVCKKINSFVKNKIVFQ